MRRALPLLLLSLAARAAEVAQFRAEEFGADWRAYGPGTPGVYMHHGASFEIRSKPISGGHGHQATYDGNELLISDGTIAPLFQQASKKMNKLILVLLAGLPALASGSGSSVEIGTNSIPLRILTGSPRTFDTNRVAREFSLYCASSSRIEDFFTADPSVPGSSGQMDPNEPEGGPPETAAENIRYHATPDERIEMGPEAANWILGILDQADIHTNAQTLATVLLDGLTSGSITNDMDWCRESFVVNGAILTNSVRDAEIRSGIASWWTKHRYYPPSLFGWRSGLLVEGGAPVSAIRVRYELPPYDGSDIRSELLVFLDGRWRIALSE